MMEKEKGNVNSLASGLRTEASLLQQQDVLHQPIHCRPGPMHGQPRGCKATVVPQGIMLKRACTRSLVL